jgi:subtilisin-like proprotein convertase family protein
MLVGDADVIADLDVHVWVQHTRVGDLFVKLVHNDSGTTVTLIDRPGWPTSPTGCTGDDMEPILNDEAAVSVEDVCDTGKPSISGLLRPTEPLSTFDGQSIAGMWTLTVSDLNSGETGVFTSWCLLLEAVGTPTATASVTSTASPTEIFTPTSTSTETPTSTPSLTPIANTVTATPSQIPTSTPSQPSAPTATPTATQSEAPTSTATLPSGLTATPTVSEPTATPTEETSPTATLEVTPTRTTIPVACVGDCTDDGLVTVDELVRGVNIALGTTPIEMCPSFDANGDRKVTVDELVKGVNNALSGCEGNGQ